MLIELFFEVAAELFGGALSSLLPEREYAPPPPEGELSASTGSIAAFFALIGALFGGTAWAAIVLRPDLDNPYPAFFVIASASSAVGAALARVTFRVTTRRRLLATIALWVSRVMMVVAIAGVVFWLF